MKPISRVVGTVPASGIRKYFDLVSQLSDVVTLGVGEPDFVTPWRIREAAIYSIEHGYTSYTSNYGIIELRRAIAEKLRQEEGIGYDPATQILITVGISEGMDLTLRAIVNPGDEIIIPEPCFVSYEACTILAGGTPVTIPTSAATGWRPTLDQIKNALSDRTKAIILGFPSNPTGVTMPRNELQRIVDVAIAHDLYIISDEIYAKLIYEEQHTCVPALKGAYDRTIYLNGFSKAYAMTGWRLGYACANAEIIEAMMKIHQYTMMCASTMAQMAAIEAIKSGDPDIAEMLEEYTQRRRVIVEGLNRIGLECDYPGGAFYAFPSIKSTGLSSEEFADKLLMDQRVLVVPGSTFGECGEGYVRCCYATSIEKIEEALTRMERFLAKG